MDWLWRLLKIGDYAEERCLGGVRSSHWPAVRKEHLRKHPHCAITGDFKDVEVHHCVPFNENPALELDPENLITLRRDMHLIFGHLMNFKSYDPDIRTNARVMADRIRNRP